MSKYVIDSETLTDIADAIRAKTGDSASMTPLEMPDEIASISGGGGGYFELLEEITVTEDVRAVNIDLTDYSGYRDLIIVENVTLSASDWMYYVRNGDTPSGGTYDNKTTGKYGVCFAWLQSPTDESFWSLTPSTDNFNLTRGKIDNLYIYTYTASSRILTGGKFQIYGKEAQS